MSTEREPFGVEAAMRRIESGVVSQISLADAQLVTRRLRECRSKAARWCAVAAEAAAGVTLSDAEREALTEVLCDAEHRYGGCTASTIRGLLARAGRWGMSDDAKENARLRAELDAAIDALDPDMRRHEIVQLRERMIRHLHDAAPSHFLGLPMRIVPSGTLFLFDRLQAAAHDVDWGQVVRNGGPPCFHVEKDGRFCLRAARWEGHKPALQGLGHAFVSLADLLDQARGTTCKEAPE